MYSSSFVQYIIIWICVIAYVTCIWALGCSHSTFYKCLKTLDCKYTVAYWHESNPKYCLLRWDEFFLFQFWWFLYFMVICPSCLYLIYCMCPFACLDVMVPVLYVCEIRGANRVFHSRDIWYLDHQWTCKSYILPNNIIISCNRFFEQIVQR